MPQPTLSHTTYVKCRPAEAWRAIVDGDLTEQYFYGTRVESTWEPGAAIRYLSADGGIVADGAVVAIEAPHRLEMDFHPRWSPEMEAEGPVREVWVVAAAGDLTKVSLEALDIDPASTTYAEFSEGLPFILSGMQRELEKRSTDGD